MKRETFDLLLGLGVLALGIALLLFTFVNALALVANPGSFLQGQVAGGAGQRPSAAFSWSSNGFNLTFQDSSRAGSGSIVSWLWNFGDNSGTASGQTPGVHVYANPGPYTVLLTVRDANGQESTTLSSVTIVSSQPRSGQSIGDIASQIPGGGTGFEQILLPVGVATLTVGLYLAMAVVGGMITKAGWNLVRPRPETIRIRLKPRHLQDAFEADMAAPPLQPTMAAQAGTPPPPPPQA